MFREGSFAPVRAKTDDKNLCGVGINFKADSTGALAVHSLLSGSPAQIDGQILPGDVLEMVDKKNVFRHSLSEVVNQLLGPQDTEVTLTFQRRTDNSPPTR